jgi:hypothetical protein
MIVIPKKERMVAAIANRDVLFNPFELLPYFMIFVLSMDKKGNRDFEK